MTSEIPSGAMVRLIAKVLSSRNTEISEVSAVIDTIYTALNDRDRVPVEMAPAAAVEAPRKRRGRPPGSTNRKTQLRPAFMEPTAAVQAPPPAPSLLRRADMVHSEPEAPAKVDSAQRLIRGVIKWYDGRTGKGSVRLPGSGDVAIDAGHLTRSGLSRLYPGQEIEASIHGAGDTVEIDRMTLIGGPQSERPIEAGPIAVRRNTKLVMVEMKRDSLRRVAARAEAEHILGPGTPAR